MELERAYVAAEPKGITGLVGGAGLSGRFERWVAPRSTTRCCCICCSRPLAELLKMRICNARFTLAENGPTCRKMTLDATMCQETQLGLALTRTMSSLD